MIINEIVLKNVACFSGEHRISLSPKLNIIAGKNNSGKSTIIKTLKLLQSGNSSFNYPKHMARVNSDDSMAIVKFENAEKRLIDIFAKGIGHPPAGFTNKIALYFGLENSIPTRLIPNQEEPNFDRKKYAHHFNFPPKEPLNPFIYFLSRRKTVGFDSQLNEESTYRVNDSLRNLPARVNHIRNTDSETFIQYSNYCKNIVGMEIGISASREGGELGFYIGNSQYIPIDAMGEGTANLVGLITELCLCKDKIFLIEELENDLHPEALRAMLDLIIEKSTSNQFIITTHSNIVVRHLGAEEGAKTLSIEMTIEGKLPTSQIKDITNRPKLKAELLRKLGYDIFDLGLYSGYLILEESTAESIINQVIIPLFIPRLAGRLRTIAANGVDDIEPRVMDFHRLFVFTHTSEVYTDRAWVRLDGDEAGIKIRDTLLNKFKKAGPSNIACFERNNFELYYPENFQEKVSLILKMEHGKAKQEAKASLLKSVLDWTLINQEEAKIEFSKSASEIIEDLKRIEAIILNRDQS